MILVNITELLHHTVLIIHCHYLENYQYEDILIWLMKMKNKRYEQIFIPFYYEPLQCHQPK
jgi:hypothetical protein